MSRLLLLAMCLLVAPNVAAAAIIEDTPFEMFFYPEFPLSTNEIGIRAFTRSTQDPVHQATLGFAIDEVSGSDNLQLDWSIGNHQWFRAEFGKVFSNETIANGDHELWGTDATRPPSEWNIEVPTNESIWIAGKFTNIDLAPVSPEFEVFGWLEFIIDDDQNPQIVASAMNYGSEDQIVVGKNLVPEPTSNFLILFAFAVIGSFLNARRP